MVTALATEMSDGVARKSGAPLKNAVRLLVKCSRFDSVKHPRVGETAVGRWTNSCIGNALAPKDALDWVAVMSAMRVRSQRPPNDPRVHWRQSKWKES